MVSGRKIFLESFETPLNSESSTETLQEVRVSRYSELYSSRVLMQQPFLQPTPRDGGSEQAKRTVSVSRQPVAQPYVPPDLPKLLLHEPVEPSEVKVPLDEGKPSHFHKCRFS